MNLSRLVSSFSFWTLSPFVLAGAFLPAGRVATAQGTHLWTQSRFEEFEKGTPNGVEITSDGKLRRGPAAGEIVTTPSTFVWSVVADQKRNGVAYLATGSPATVLRVSGLRVSPGGKSDTLFESKALAVQVLRMGPDGMLYAATIPDGKVYRLKPDATGSVDEAKAEVVFDLGKMQDQEAAASQDKLGEKGTVAQSANGQAGNAKSSESKARYIWDMTFDSTGRLYIATGGPGAIYRLDLNNGKPKPELFFKSDEQHIRALAWDKQGNLIAGSDGSGLVYRISPEGKAYVLFSAPRREVTALAVGADGVIYEADVGDKSHNPLPALPVQAGGSSITINFVSPESVQAANASVALPEGTEVFALTANAAPRKVWSGKDDVVYSLSATKYGLMALTGNRGQVLMISGDGSYRDVAHLDAQQAVTMAEIPDGWLVATANTGKLYSLSTGPAVEAKDADDHSYASDILDAGAAARWGRVEVDPNSHGYQVFTRSGNVEQPVRKAKDWGWSDWQPLAEGKIASPVGRYLQWKVALAADGELGGVGVNFLPVNAAPSVDDVLVAPGARFVPQPPSGQIPTVTLAFPNNGQNGGVVIDTGANATAPVQAQKDRTAVTVRWNAHDDNGDDLSYEVMIKGDTEQAWRLLKKGITEKVYSFDGASLPDGGYVVKVVASDAPSHTPGDALTGELVSERFELDTTPPMITNLQARAVGRIECSGPCQGDVLIPVSFDAADATSPISRAEYSIDSGKWQYIEPVGQISDSKQEHYSFQIPVLKKIAEDDGKDDSTSREAAAEHLVTVRVFDRHDNGTTAKVLVPAVAGSAPGRGKKK